MENKNSFFKIGIRGKILLPIFSFIILLMIVVIIQVYNVSNNKLDEYFQSLINKRSDLLKSEIDKMKNSSLSMLDWFKNSPRLIIAINKNNKTELKSIVTKSINSFDIDFVTITNKNGIVLYSSVDTNLSNSSLSNDEFVKNALENRSIAGVNTNKNLPINISSSSPIIDEKGKIVGTITLGYNLASEKFVDKIKNNTGNEATVFLGNKRAMTTITNEEGKRIIGTELGIKEIENTVLIDNKIFYGESSIRGSRYKAAYLPISTNDNKVIGMV